MDSKQPRCSVCGGKCYFSVKYPFDLRVDPLCEHCFSWLYELAKSYNVFVKPYRLSNPYVIYYDILRPIKNNGGM